MERERLDITKLTTVEDIDNVPWRNYFGDVYSWVKYIVYPLSQKELSRVCRLAEGSDKVILNNSGGDLHYYKRK